MTSPSPDVVVIGAGAVGALCALELAERGHRVVLFDRQGPCREASGATFSWVAAHSKEPLHYHRFSRAAIALHPDLSERLGVDLEWRPCFSLYAEVDEDECQQRKAATQRKRELGFGLEWLEGADARAMVPLLCGEVKGASLCRGEGTLNAFRLVLGALDAARRLGVDLRYHQPVLALLCDDQGVVGVRTADGVVPCRQVVLASGHRGAELARSAGLGLPLAQVKGELLVTEPWPERLPGVVADVQQTPSGNFLIGVTWEPDLQDRTSTAHNLEATARRVCRVLPFLRQVRVIRSFAGVRPVPHDMVSYLGPTALCPGLYFALSHSGITLAPLMARVLADFLGGESPRDWHPGLSPDRALERL